MRKLIDWLRAPEWSPYTAGAALGVLSMLALLFTNRLLGASGAFENIAGALMKVIAPSLEQNMYWRFVMPAGFSLGVAMLIGIMLGSFLSAIVSGTFKWRAVSDDQWVRVFGPSVWKRWLALFIGGVIIEYGAGIAGGCTSGLAVSGGEQLAPSAYMFIIGMFVSGVLTAKILYGRRY